MHGKTLVALLADIVFAVIPPAEQCAVDIVQFHVVSRAGVFHLRPRDTATKIFSAWRCRACEGLVDTRDARLKISHRHSKVFTDLIKVRKKYYLIRSEGNNFHCHGKCTRHQHSREQLLDRLFADRLCVLQEASVVALHASLLPSPNRSCRVVDARSTDHMMSVRRTVSRAWLSFLSLATRARKQRFRRA